MQLETSDVEQNYSKLGQNASHPGLITGIFLYASSQGIFSSREIKLILILRQAKAGRKM